MKLFVLFIFSVVSANVFAQAKQLNKLLKQYAYSWNKHPPLALQNSKELLVPDLIGLDTLSVIKWKDIDSITITESSNGHYRLVLYGEVIKYRKCKATAGCNVKYLDTVYHQSTITDHLWMPLALKKNGENIPLPNKVRRKLMRSLHNLNNIHITEYYKPRLPNIQPVEYKRRTKEIIVYQINSNEKLSLKAKYLQHANKITIRYPGIDKIVSFDLFVIGDSTLVSNKGSGFNTEGIRLLKKVQAGAIIILDAIKVMVSTGDIRTLQMGLTFFAK